MDAVVCFHKKEASSRDVLPERHKVTPFLSDEETPETRELAQLKREIEIFMMTDELMSVTEGM